MRCAAPAFGLSLLAPQAFCNRLRKAQPVLFIGTKAIISGVDVCIGSPVMLNYS
jgi:hypothetical protein